MRNRIPIFPPSPTLLREFVILENSPLEPASDALEIRGLRIGD